ncbi:two-component system response regulator [Candidatus Omnitrophota bacterium]
MNNFFFHKKAKILIIDDEKDICDSLGRILERTGKYEVWTTTSPIKSISLAKKNHPDLILLDIIMPEMNGAIVAERLAKDPSTKDIRIAFVTVLAGQKEIKKGYGLIGGHPFISKPFSKEKILERIEFLLQEPNYPH